MPDLLEDDRVGLVDDLQVARIEAEGQRDRGAVAGPRAVDIAASDAVRLFRWCYIHVEVPLKREAK
jgi:hypothetical protein